MSSTTRRPRAGTPSKSAVALRVNRSAEKRAAEKRAAEKTTTRKAATKKAAIKKPGTTGASKKTAVQKTAVQKTVTPKAVTQQLVSTTPARAGAALPASPLQPIIETRSNFTWRNWHSSSQVGGLVDLFSSPLNRWFDGTPTGERPWEPGLEALRQIVRQAEVTSERVRCFGSGWSLSDIAFTHQNLVNTARLSSYFVGFRSESMLAPAYRPIKNRIVFAQCGTQIVSLNNALALASPRLALPTSGASNGQTIVGATQTGTHGSAHDYGPMPNFLRALHIVGEQGKHYLVQPKSHPVVTQAFADYLGAELREDDELFRAATLGLGSFGLIHAVLLEAVPIYGLDRFVEQVDFGDVEQAIYDFDVAGLGLPSGDDLPWHFEVVVNPYLRGRGEKGAFIRTYSKFPISPTDALPVIPVVNGEPQNSEDLVAMGGLLTDLVPAVIPHALQGRLIGSLRPTGGKTIAGTPGGQFADSQPTNGGTSMELGVPFQSVKDVAAAIFGVTEQYAFGSPVAFRWVKASDQTLAFSLFAPVTCHIEMPGVDAERTREGYRRVWTALDSAGLEYTCHFGQYLPISPAWMEKAYGKPRIDAWRAARRSFLSPKGCWTFGSALLDSYQLAK